MEYTYKQIQDYYHKNNLEQSDTIYNDLDSIVAYGGTLKQKKSVWYDLVGSEFEFE